MGPENAASSNRLAAVHGSKKQAQQPESGSFYVCKPGRRNEETELYRAFESCMRQAQHDYPEGVVPGARAQVAIDVLRHVTEKNCHRAFVSALKAFSQNVDN